MSKISRTRYIFKLSLKYIPSNGPTAKFDIDFFCVIFFLPAKSVVSDDAYAEVSVPVPTKKNPTRSCKQQPSPSKDKLPACSDVEETAEPKESVSFELEATKEDDIPKESDALPMETEQSDMNARGHDSNIQLDSNLQLAPATEKTVKQSGSSRSLFYQKNLLFPSPLVCTLKEILLCSFKYTSSS